MWPIIKHPDRGRDAPADTDRRNAMATSSTSGGRAVGRRATLGQIIRAGLTAAVLAAVVNVIIGFVAAPVVDAPAQLAPMQPVSIAVSTIAGVLLATVVFAFINRFSSRPARLFTIVALVLLVLSYSNPIVIMGSDSPRFAGMTWPIAFVAMVMHTVAAAFSIVMLTRTVDRS